MKYPSFDQAIKRCLKELDKLEQYCDGEGIAMIFLGKSDMRSAFRNLGLKPKQFRYLLMKARSPIDGKWYLFVDKCLPFGASVSCAVFQSFSDSVAHIVKFRTGNSTVNYLDDYLFAAFLRNLCNMQIKEFLWICEEINFPVSIEKTEWASPKLTFLGLLIDAINKIIAMKRQKQ